MKIAIVGTGMIGGAVARAARRLRSVREVTGVDNNPVHAADAVRLGLVQRMQADVPDDADIVVIATPSEAIADRVIELRDHRGVIIDVGSVKGAIVSAVRARLGSAPPRYVPCHPLAGSEKHGPAHAPEQLFHERLLILTPLPETDPRAIATAEVFWRDLGSILHTMPLEDHDRILARTSHLPHLLAFAFMHGIADEELRFSGGGFRDFSRIAASSPELWWKIFELNRDTLLAAVDRFDADLKALREALATNDSRTGLRLLAEAADRRRKLP
ncbi:MAG: prephenate dehydrogenase/arogenate dehydrogenase family protein [Gammaproteobacteria bacterium]|nr:prephenate dehydrogenase/arogenate dehydrogenase family protein [Gammaproteobacteria bacterium]